MLARFRPREFDSNKQSTAELLAILLQNSPKNQQLLADENGIDILLQVTFCPQSHHFLYTMRSYHCAQDAIHFESFLCPQNDMCPPSLYRNATSFCVLLYKLDQYSRDIEKQPSMRTRFAQG